MFSRLRQFFAPERKSLAAPDAALLAALGASGPTAAGVSVGAGSALTMPAVSAAVTIISNAAACLDIRVMRREGADEVAAPDHPVAALLRDGPNAWTSTHQWIRDMVAGALLFDEGAASWVNRVGGRVAEAILYDRGCITVERALDGTGEKTFRLHGQEMAAADIVHVQAPLGRAPATLARESIGLALTLDAHAARLFSNGARPSGVLHLKDKATPDTVRKIKEAWQLAHGGGKSGGTAIIEGGAEYQQLTMTSVDAQYQEMRAFAVVEVARAFNISVTLLQDLERATWSNMEQAGLQFLNFTLEPWLREVEGALRRALFTDEERPNYVIRFDRDDMSRVDLTARATAINSLIASRVLSPNEGREWLGLSRRDGGDVYENPNTGASQPGTGAPQNGGPA